MAARLGASDGSASIALHAGEHAVWSGPASLVEPRRQRGHYQGGSSGVSIPVGGGMRVRVGQMRGTYVPGPEVQTPIDDGSATITDRRVVFVGGKATREWAFAKLVAVESTHDGKTTLLPVSNRQKVSGLVVEDADGFEYFLAVGRFAFEHGAQAAVEAAAADAADHGTSRP